MTKGYIFDYGGTLDTGGDHWGQVLWHAYERCGVPVAEEQFRAAYVAVERLLGSQPIIRPHYTFRQTLETKIGLQLQQLEKNATNRPYPLSDARAAGALREQFLAPLVADAYALTQRHTAQSRAVLERLRLDYPLALVSNFYGNLPVVLREFGFEGLFSQVVESARVGLRKPDGRLFLMAIEALGLLPEEVVVVGDSFKNDILPALQLGCRAVWLKGEAWEKVKEI